MRTLARLLLLGALLAMAAITASPVLAAGYDGTYSVQHQTLTVQFKIGLKLGVKGDAVQTTRKFDIRGGQLPANAFAKDKDAWTNKIISWRLWPKQREIVAIAAVNRAYDDLLTQLNKQLKCFADRMTVRQTGVFQADLKLEDSQCGQTATVKAAYDSSKGTFAAAKLNPVDIAFRPGWLVLGGSGAKLEGSLAQGKAKWDVQALLLGTPYGGGGLTVNLGLQGDATLTRVSP